jgi:oxygen-independent coproporphyrinogen-3 oxidase
MAGVYVHLPFCPYLCPYCDFAKWPYRRSSAQRYLAALHAEIADAPAFAAQTLFIGGGTPNTYSPGDLTRLLAALRTRFAFAAGSEISIEVNPDLDRCDGFAAYHAAGINRLSVGVQSFDASELATLGRRHGASDVAEVVRRARAAGFDNISLDLIFAVPGQTADSWRRTLMTAVALGVEHVSTYGLTVEEGTPYARWQRREPSAFCDDRAEAELYGIAIDTLSAAGFEQYEISNFARPGYACAHNRNYWENGEYLGLGVGAASYLGGERSIHTRDFEAYVSAASAHAPIPGEAERLEGAARLGEATMLALRTGQGVDLRGFAERYGVDFLRYYESVIAQMREAGMLIVDPEHVRLTRAGRFVANDVCAAFVGYDERQAATGTGSR